MPRTWRTISPASRRSRGCQAYKRHAYAALRVGEGARVLDVGCGIGGDVRGIAQLVGRTGRVVGLDFTEAFVAEARQQSADHPTIEYRQGDAHALPFADASFDAARSERVFQHLADPRTALAEMRGVTRPDGRVVVTEPDWDTLVLDLPDHVTLARKIRSFWTTRPPGTDGWAGSSRACSVKAACPENTDFRCPAVCLIRRARRLSIAVSLVRSV